MLVFLLVIKDLLPYLKVPLDVRCLGMKLNHWNIAELPTIYDPERFLSLLCTNFMFTSCVFGVKCKHVVEKDHLCDWSPEKDCC